MDSRLPDVNSSFVFYRKGALAAYRARLYDMCKGMLHGFNVLMTPEYRVETDTAKYFAGKRVRLLATCRVCKKEIEYADAPKHEVELDALVQIMTGKEKQAVWYCTKCKAQNANATTSFIRDAPAEPSVLKCVPEAPTKWDTGLGPNEYHALFGKWYINYQKELDAQASLFRGEWAENKSDSYDDDLEDVAFPT